MQTGNIKQNSLDMGLNIPAYNTLIIRGNALMKKLLFLVFFLVLSINAYASDNNQQTKTGIITGRIMIEGDKSIGGGKVFFTVLGSPPPSATKYWRVPDEATDIDKNGNFTAILPEGQYYMGAIRKVSGDKISGDNFGPGPPNNGDILYISRENSKPKVHTVKKGETTDLGTISGAAPLSAEMLASAALTAIEGTITDTNGKPIGGAVVAAYSSQTLVGKPLFVSYRTDINGKYQIRVYEGGKYYLRVRENYGGGPPVVGNIVGTYGEKEPLEITVKTGEILKEVNIKAMRFLGRGHKGQE